MYQLPEVDNIFTFSPLLSLSIALYLVDAPLLTFIFAVAVALVFFVVFVLDVVFVVVKYFLLDHPVFLFDNCILYHPFFEDNTFTTFPFLSVYIDLYLVDAPVLTFIFDVAFT